MKGEDEESKAGACLRSPKNGQSRSEGEGGMAAWNGIAGVISQSCRGRISIKLPITRPENCSEI